MRNSRLWAYLNCPIDEEELKKIAKEDIRDIKGPKTVAAAGPFLRKSRLASFLSKSPPEQSSDELLSPA